MRTAPVRAAVIADTHGVLRPEVERILETCDVIIHAGDFDNQMLYHKLNVNQPLYAVRGNNDRGWSGGLPKVKRFEVGGVRFIMAHERTDIPSALGDTQVVIFGHSHMYYQQEISGRLWLNPGSCGYKRFTLPLSMAVMTLQDGSYEVETVWLEKSYGTPGAVKAGQNGSPAGTGAVKESKYQRQQRRYQQKVKQKQESAENGAAGQSAEISERDRLFLIAKILRFRKAGETQEWIINHTGMEASFVEKVFRVCEQTTDPDARHILSRINADPGDA